MEIPSKQPKCDTLHIFMLASYHSVLKLKKK